jgi:Coenzyme PQQ synthesis protein D (PqqD)
MQDREPFPAAVEANVVVLSIRAGFYFDFNRTGSEIWNMLAEPCRVQQIVDTLAEGYDVDVSTVTRDVTAFLQALVDSRLVQVISPSATPSTRLCAILFRRRMHPSIPHT